MGCSATDYYYEYAVISFGSFGKTTNTSGQQLVTDIRTRQDTSRIQVCVFLVTSRLLRLRIVAVQEGIGRTSHCLTAGQVVGGIIQPASSRAVQFVQWRRIHGGNISIVPSIWGALTEELILSCCLFCLYLFVTTVAYEERRFYLRSSSNSSSSSSSTNSSSCSSSSISSSSSSSSSSNSTNSSSCSCSSKMVMVDLWASQLLKLFVSIHQLDCNFKKAAPPCKTNIVSKVIPVLN
jgi:hypothetical protein